MKVQQHFETIIGNWVLIKKTTPAIITYAAMLAYRWFIDQAEKYKLQQLKHMFLDLKFDYNKALYCSKLKDTIEIELECLNEDSTEDKKIVIYFKSKALKKREWFCALHANPQT